MTTFLYASCVKVVLLKKLKISHYTEIYLFADVNAVKAINAYKLTVFFDR